MVRGVYNKVIMLGHPIDLLSGNLPGKEHLRSPLYFTGVFRVHLAEVIAATVAAVMQDSEWVINIGLVPFIRGNVCNI